MCNERNFVDDPRILLLCGERRRVFNSPLQMDLHVISLSLPFLECRINDRLFQVSRANLLIMCLGAFARFLVNADMQYRIICCAR